MVYALKIECVSDINIFGLKMMMKSGLEKIQSSKNDKVGPMIIFLFVSCWFLGIFG